MSLPVEQSLPEIKHVLNKYNTLVLQAPPGAGKTTRVPLALLNEPWLENKKILLLEPRRLAAKSCASHMASMLGEKVGQTVGYRIRLETKVGSDTWIEVITQGVFTRMIQGNPGLEDIGLVIFDEFHERSLQNDLGFALCNDAAQVFCDDLKILIMSATMDVSAVSSLMDDAHIVSSHGRQYDVNTIYRGPGTSGGHAVFSAQVCLMTIKKALEETQEDILVFLPGVGEIRKVQSLAEEAQWPGVLILPLYGNLSFDQQHKVFSPSNLGQRKIILATSIAETSITIDGIGVVIDSGLMRVPRFSPRTGMTHLETIPVSKATADQRQGRAGRLSNGVCYRLWSEYEHRLLKPFTPPQILSADLCSLVLELAAWGTTDPLQLKWIDSPDPVAFKQAQTLLISLGGLDQEGRITAHGKKMVRTGLHPRLAHMVIKSDEKGAGNFACLIAAILEERDILKPNQGMIDPDFRYRLEIMQTAINQRKKQVRQVFVKQNLVKKIIKTYSKIAASLSIKQGTIEDSDPGELLALAYPDRIAKKRVNFENRYLTALGKGASFFQPNSLSKSEYIVALHLDGKGKDAKIFLAVPISRESIEKEFSNQFETKKELVWDENRAAIKATEQVRYKKILIQESNLNKIDPEKAADLLLAQIQKRGLQSLPWTKKVISFKQRAVFLKKLNQYDKITDLSDSALLDRLDQWLKPFVYGISSLRQLEKIDFKSAFFSLLTWDEQQIIEKNAPTHLVVPSGSKLPLQYSSQGKILSSPVLKVRLQEIFSMISTPTIAGVPVTVHILSPASRPVQITNDLKSFWENTYQDVKKDLMGRYPKHYWPDDPFTALPTSRVRPKKS